MSGTISNRRELAEIAKLEAETQKLNSERAKVEAEKHKIDTEISKIEADIEDQKSKTRLEARKIFSAAIAAICGLYAYIIANANTFLSIESIYLKELAVLFVFGVLLLYTLTSYIIESDKERKITRHTILVVIVISVIFFIAHHFYPDYFTALDNWFLSAFTAPPHHG